jgi:hypothetical protein
MFEVVFLIFALGTSKSDGICQIILIEKFRTKIDERIAGARRVLIISISDHRARFTITYQLARSLQLNRWKSHTSRRKFVGKLYRDRHIEP